MKKVVHPSRREEAVYYSDFSGKCFGDLHPEAVVTLDFNYGSQFDGGTLRFDLTDDEAKQILDFLKPKLCAEFKQHIERQLTGSEKEYQESCEARDWTACEHISDEIELWKYLLTP